MNKATDFILDVMPIVAGLGVIYLMVKFSGESGDEEDEDL